MGIFSFLAKLVLLTMLTVWFVAIFLIYIYIYIHMYLEMGMGQNLFLDIISIFGGIQMS